MGLKKNAPSPTFVIMRRHALKGRRNLFHIDAYRLKKAADLEALDFGKIVADPANIILIEWADRAKKIMPKGTKWIRFAHGPREHERIIKGVS